MSDTRLESDLSSALRRGQLFAHFQPQQDLATGRIVSVEALCRWRHPILGMLPPSLFIPIAEELGLIHDIGIFMLEQSYRAAIDWQFNGMQLEISVNVSATQLATPGFSDRVISLIRQSPLPPRTLTVEITETVPLIDLPAVISRLTVLRECGLGVSLDDYGTGHTSLSQLDELPVTELKLDKSLVQSQSAGVAAELARLLEYVHGRDIRVVAEGVETASDLDRVRRLGCDRAQGYLLGMPMAREDLDSLLLRSRTR